MISTRTASADDGARIVALLQQLLTQQPENEQVWGPALRELLLGDRGAAIVAEDETGVLGVITLSYNFAVRYGGEYAAIEELVVDETARGKRVGAALVQAGVEAARERGAAEISLYSRPENQSFYEKMGFRYFGPGLLRDLRGGRAARESGPQL